MFNLEVDTREFFRVFTGGEWIRGRFIPSYIDRKTSEALNLWYAVFVATGEEDNVRERLLYKFRNIEDPPQIVIPKREMRERKGGIWRTCIRTLFPGYVLIRGYVGIDEYNIFKGVPGVVRILKDKSGLLTVNPDEINVISRLISDGEVIGPSRVYMNGGRVEVVDGPLMGMEGLIESIDKRKGRVKVKFNFVGEPRLVDLSVTMIQPA